MKEMIVETLASMKEQLLDNAANLEFTGQRSRVKTLRLCRISVSLHTPNHRFYTLRL